MRPLLLAVAAAVIVSAALASPANAWSKPCGFITSDGASVHVKVLRGRTSCATARTILRSYLASEAPCDGSACVRKHRGWTCLTSASSFFPRLASCERGRSRIAAYSTAD